MRNLFKKKFGRMMETRSKKTDKNVQKKKGFTLVEILIVIAVIGILFVTLVPRIDFAGNKARETGIKTDFRSFELAAEQLLREKGGIADFVDSSTGTADVALLAGTNGINLYLDEALKFADTGVCAKEDQWNQNYTVQIVKSSDTNANNGAIFFISNGKDSLIDEEEDNYVLAVTFQDGTIASKTVGFSSNIESDLMPEITSGTSSAMTVVDKEITVLTYDSSAE